MTILHSTLRHAAVVVAGLTVAAAAACASVDYYDTNADVDARVECAGYGANPTGEPVPGWCKREQGVRASSGSDGGTNIDFSGGNDDGG